MAAIADFFPTWIKDLLSERTERRSREGYGVKNLGKIDVFIFTYPRRCATVEGIAYIYLRE